MGVGSQTAAFAAVALCVSAAGRAAQPADGLVFFESKIRPVLVKHCYECHSADDANGGLALDSRAGLLHGGDSGETD